MAKKIYVGVPTEIPIYETNLTEVNCSSQTILEQYFTIERGPNDDGYGFHEGPNGTWKSYNYYYEDEDGTAFDEDNTIAEWVLTAKTSVWGVSFKYGVSSEQDYDIFSICLNDTEIVSVSGEKNDLSWSGDISAGQKLTFTYIKDESNCSGSDQGWFYDVVVTTGTKVQIGSETKSVARNIPTLYTSPEGVARKIKKVYVGVEGVARLTYEAKIKWEKYKCYSTFEGYVELSPWGQLRFYYNGSSSASFYEDYTFSEQDGFTGIGETTFYFPNDLDNAIGYYEIRDDAVYQIESYKFNNEDDWPVDAPYDAIYYWSGPNVAKCERQYSWTDIEYIGTIEAESGVLPEDGTVVAGGLDLNYIILRIDGYTYRYYRQQ